MSDEKPRFMPFYLTFQEAIEKLPEEDQLTAYKALLRYFFYAEEPQDLPFAVSLIFSLAKPSLDKARTNRENAQKAIEKRWEKQREKEEKRKSRKPLKS